MILFQLAFWLSIFSLFSMFVFNEIILGVILMVLSFTLFMIFIFRLDRKGDLEKWTIE